MGFNSGFKGLITHASGISRQVTQHWVEFYWSTETIRSFRLMCHLELY